MGETRETEPGHGAGLMSDNSGRPFADVGLFLRRPQKSPFLAPQKSKKSRSEPVWSLRLLAPAHAEL